LIAAGFTVASSGKQCKQRSILQYCPRTGQAQGRLGMAAAKRSRFARQELPTSISHFSFSVQSRRRHTSRCCTRPPTTTTLCKHPSYRYCSRSILRPAPCCLLPYSPNCTSRAHNSPLLSSKHSSPCHHLHTRLLARHHAQAAFIAMTACCCGSFSRCCTAAWPIVSSVWPVAASALPTSFFTLDGRREHIICSTMLTFPSS
jgi:hypothetical protein